MQYVPTIFAAIKLRHHSKLPVGFKLPGGLTIPVLALLVTMYLTLSFSVTLVLTGLGIFLVSALWYLYDDRDRKANGLERDISAKDRPF